MGRVNVIVKEVGKDPHITSIPNMLRPFQTLVDGHIECITLRINGKVGVLIVNEEGRLLGLDYNFTNHLGEDLVGDVVFAGIKGDEFIDCPWDLDEIKEYAKERVNG